MYLTRFRVNTARAGARRLSASPQMMHAGVMSSFATSPPQGADGPRVLWRMDRNSRAETHLYIVSPDRPDLTHLTEQAGWPTTGGWDTADYGAFLARLSKGDQWSFRLTANPVHSIRRTDDEPTKVTAHITPRHQIEWLLKRQEAAGFRVLAKPAESRLLEKGDEYDLLVHDRRQLRFQKKRGGRPVTLVTVTYDGRLEVLDPEALRRTLTHGLGRAKAYGCGLLTLAPA